MFPSNMWRRDVSNREKLRAREKELDEQLQEAGIDAQGMSYEEKKEIFAMLEESRKSAVEEETQRQQLIANEERILTETLNISSSCIEEPEDAEVTESTEGKKDADVKITSGSPVASQVSEADCISSSNSSTPDLFPAPSESPSKPNQLQSPLRLSGKSMSKNQSSEDLFLFSQTSTKLGVDENVIKNCIETIRVSESEDEDEDDNIFIPFKNSSSPIPRSPVIKSRTPDKQKLSDITSSADGTLRNSPIAEVSPIQPRPSLRRYQSEDNVDTPKSRIQYNDSEDGKSSSQPIVQKQLRKVIDGLGSKAGISPVIGQRKKLAAIGTLSISVNKVDTIQDSEVSDSLSAKPIHSSSPDLISDDDVSGTEVESSRGSQPIVKEDNEVHSSSKANVPNGGMLLNKAGKRKMALRDDNVSNEIESRGQLTASPKRVTPRILPRSQDTLTFKGPELSDSDEDHVIEKKKDGKKNINVFVTTVHDMALKRKNEKSEDCRKVYFKNTSESLSHAYERIIDLIDKSFSTIEEYQKTLPGRMPWPLPIRVDKRVKDSLNHPKVSSRRNMEVSHSNIDLESTRMVTRHTQLKTAGMTEEDASLSEDSLPEPGDDGNGWYDARKCRDKRRGIQVGLSRKRVRCDSSEKIEDKSKALMNSLAVGNESDSEEFDMPVAKITRLNPVSREKEVASPDIDSIEGTSSSTSKMQPSLSRRGARFNSGRKFEDKPKVAVTSVTVVNESDSEDLYVPVTRNASPFLRQRAKPTPLKDSNGGLSLSKILEEEQTNFDIGDILADSQEERGSTRRDGREEKASINKDDLEERVSMSRKGLSVSQVNRKKIGVASISGIDDCKPSTSGLRYPIKRPRKTFRLNVDGADEPLQNSEASSSMLMDKEDTKSSVKPSSVNHIATVVEDEEEGSISTNSLLESKGDPPAIVSSFEDDVKDNAATLRQIIDEDLCVIESSSASRPKRGRGNHVPLKPPPLKMKKKTIKARGKTASGDESQKDQIAAAEPSQQVVSSNPEGTETQGGEEMEVECPLCQKPFPFILIEAHASSCGELVAEVEPRRPVGNSLRGRRKNAQPLENRIQASASDEDVKVARFISTRERTPSGCARCFHCKSVFQEGDEYVLHIQDCQAELTAEMSSWGSRTPGAVQKTHRAGVMSPHTSRMGRTPVTRPTSLFDKLEGGSEIQFHRGDITDPVYSKPNTALTHIVNCVAVRPHGLSQVLADKYPYCNTYNTRRPIRDLNRSCFSDRDTPGTIKICRSKSEFHKTPLVVNIFGQFYMGKTYNRNLMSKRLVSQMKSGIEVSHVIPAKNNVSGRNTDPKAYDSHLVNGIESDTQMNRIKWFKEALQKLTEEIPKEDIKRVVFPFKIGCGLAGGNWEKDYFPAIQTFHHHVSQSGVEVIIVEKSEKVLSDCAAVIQDTLRLSSPNSTLPHRSYTSKSETKTFPSPKDGSFSRNHPSKGKGFTKGKYSPDVWERFSRESQS